MRARRGVSFDQMSIGLLFVALALVACLMPAQADTFWHLRAGADIVRGRQVPRFDTYSYTAAGLPWPDHEWLWQAFAYAMYRVGGMPLLTGAAATIAIAAVAITHRLMLGPAPTRFILLLLAIPVSSFMWALRPQIVTLLLLVVLLSLLVRERYWPLPPLFLVWANTHGGVSLGGLLLAAAFVAALLRAWHGERSDRRRALFIGALLPICALATAATPLGFGIFPFVLRSESRLRVARIAEWLPTLPTAPVEGMFWALAAAFVALVVVRRRSLRQASWADTVAVVGAFALLPLAFRSVRNIAPFLMVGVVAASRLLGPHFRFRRKPSPDSPDRPRLNAMILCGFGAVAVLAVGVAWMTWRSHLGWSPVPPAALAAVRACPEQLYNHYNEGGYLIWFVPEKRVFVDSRQDPYPLPFLLEHIRVEGGKAPYQPLFDRWGIHCAFLGVKSPTAETLTAKGWSARFRDDKWVVLASP